MADDVAVTVRFGDDEPLVEFPSEGVTVSVPLSPVGDRLYRLDGAPIFAESASFGDVIEAEQGEGGTLRFVGLPSEAGGGPTTSSCRRTRSIASGGSPCSRSCWREAGIGSECSAGCYSCASRPASTSTPRLGWRRSDGLWQRANCSLLLAIGFGLTCSNFARTKCFSRPAGSPLWISPPPCGGLLSFTFLSTGLLLHRPTDLASPPAPRVTILPSTGGIFSKLR